MRRLRLSGVRPKRIGVPEAEAPLAPCGQKQLVSLRAKPIDLADDFTGMLEALLDLPQQFLLFVVRHIPPCEVAFPPPTHRPSNWEVTASTERLQGLRVTDLTVTRYLTDLAEFCVNQNAAMTNRRFPAPWSVEELDACREGSRLAREIFFAVQANFVNRRFANPGELLDFVLRHKK
jgi:hypothetical protein